MNTPPPYDDSEKAPEAVDQDRLQRIVSLNDQFRLTGFGGVKHATDGIHALPIEQQRAIFQEICVFNNFTPENDPYGEHDFGSVEVDGVTAFWKIDYYDKTNTMHSPDKSDYLVTNRVMTIMLASEY